MEIIPTLNIFILVLMALGFIVFFAFWLIALIHSLTSKERPEHKLFWSFVIIVLNIIGAVLYVILKDYSKKAIDTKKRLSKNTKDGILFGVCAGLGKYFGIDSNLVRIVFILLLFVTAGNVIIFYILAAILLPTDRALKKSASYEKSTAKKEKKSETKTAKTQISKVDKKIKAQEKRKSPLLYFLIALFVIFVIITIFASIIIAGFVLFYSYESTNHEYIVREIEIEQKLVSEMVAEEIKEHPMYRQNNGHELIHLESRESQECSGQRIDGSLIVVHENDCREFVHRFLTSDKKGIDGYLVETLVFRGDIIGMEFNEF